jgi:cation diffusion facilitator CzcD-associated flavoprotein CzcO
MEMQCQTWKDGTEEFVSQSVIADYVQSAAAGNEIGGSLRLNTRVESVEKEAGEGGSGGGWRVETSTLEDTPLGPQYSHESFLFDAVVVANGH